jgi:acetyltransferase-like isoleucine patch superfamily enzyme
MWFRLIMLSTGWLGDVTPILRMRGYMMRPAFKKCGRNFQIASGAIINWSSNVVIGDDVFVANYCWIQGIGGVELHDECMLGPFTVLATNNHTVVGGSYRHGSGKCEKISVGRGAWTGAHVVITAGVAIGSGTAIAAGAVVTKDVPSHSVASGIPALSKKVL